MSPFQALKRLASRIKEELTGRKLLWNILYVLNSPHSSVFVLIRSFESFLSFRCSFYVGHLAIFAYGWYKQVMDLRLAGLNKLRYSVWISRGAGLCLGIDGLLIILPRELPLFLFV